MRLRPLLAGPILRRTEPSRVCLWIATSSATDSAAEIYRLGPDGRPAGEAIARGSGERVRLGRALFVHLIEIHVDGSLPVGELLAYDLSLIDGDRSLRLADLGLIGGDGGINYEGFALPTFVLHDGAGDLNLLHGSCRLLHGKGEDAFVAADELMARRACDVGSRPSALLLTGDQIYGDEVAGPLIRHLSELGRALIGEEDDSSVPGVGGLRDVPVYGRAEIVTERAGFTSGNADNHLMTFGEFAAMYLCAFGEHNWPERLPTSEEALGEDRSNRRTYEDEARCLERERAGLPHARRVLANVPTYMAFDDHDVTDDWNITEEWVEKVRASSAGKRIVANALASFWAFQGWGNDPDSSDEALKKVIFAHLVEGEPGSAFEDAMWSFDRWSYAVPLHPTVIMLDTRTQRAFDDEQAGARLIGAKELQRLGDLVRGAHRGGGPLVLMSPVPVYGLELQERRQKFLVGKVGPYEIDFEAWHSNLAGFVDFMNFLAHDLDVSTCVLLSGDVHYGMNVRASFETRGKRIDFAQLVSSSFKHSGALSKAGIELLGKLVSNSHERIGWDHKPSLEVDSGIRRRFLKRAANTDEWSEDGPVFLAPRRAQALGIDEEADYREKRRYVVPEKGSVLIGENNIGLVTLRGNRIEHRLLCPTDGVTERRADIDLGPVAG